MTLIRAFMKTYCRKKTLSTLLGIRRKGYTAVRARPTARDRAESLADLTHKTQVTLPESPCLTTPRLKQNKGHPLITRLINMMYYWDRGTRAGRETSAEVKHKERPN